MSGGFPRFYRDDWPTPKPHVSRAAAIVPGFALRVHRDEPDQVEIWLDTEFGVMDGLCVGVGRDFASAKADLVAEFERMLAAARTLEEPTP
jgi:hypothetical protein